MPVDPRRFDADQRSPGREFAGQPGQIQQIGEADFMHASPEAAKLTIHRFALENPHGAGDGSHPCRIDDDQLTVRGDGLGQGEAEGSSVQERKRAAGSETELQQPHSDGAGRLIAEQGVADAEHERRRECHGVAGGLTLWGQAIRRLLPLGIGPTAGARQVSRVEANGVATLGHLFRKAACDGLHRPVRTHCRPAFAGPEPNQRKNSLAMAY